MNLKTTNVGILWTLRKPFGVSDIAKQITLVLGVARLVIGLMWLLLARFMPYDGLYFTISETRFWLPPIHNSLVLFTVGKGV